MLSFEDVNGLKNNKKCCDSGQTCQSNPCDPRIVGCISSIINSTHNCNIGQFATQHYIDQNIVSFRSNLGLNIKNPLLYHFKNGWKSNKIDIYFRVEDIDTGQNRELIENFYDIFEVHIFPSRIKAVPIHRSLLGTVSTISYNVTIYCSDNFYGNDCAIFCQSSNETHYMCGKDGGKYCKNKWYGEECLLFCEPHDNSAGHYTCSKNGEKICLPYWYGENCMTYCTVKNSTSSSYRCSETGEKICSQHWYGINCDRFCNSNIPDRGHYTCDQTNGTKICLPSWYGVNCDTFCKETENSHYICNSYTGEKRCFSDYYGKGCDVYCKADAISNYTCNEAGDKICHKHFYGKDCSIYGNIVNAFEIVFNIFS